MSLQNINSYTYTPGFTQGQYHNAVLCISGNVQSLYLNGVLVGSTTTASNILSYYPTINQILVGCAGDKSNGFTGYLDDFRIYKYAFNQSQVSNLYSNRNLIAYYPFDVCFNNVANNINTTGNNATLAYDATLIGNATISTTTDNYLIGSDALNLTNTAGTTSTSYVNSTCGFSTTATNQVSISLWFKTTGIAGRKMRLFDLCPATGSQGIFVDISGTNGIRAGASNTIISYTIPAVTPTPISYTTNFTTGTPTGGFTSGTVFDGWTATSITGAGLSSDSFYGSSYMDATQNASASGRSILFGFYQAPAGSQCSISRSIYLYANYTYTLTFFIGTRTGQYYNSNNYFRGTVTNASNNSTPNPIFNITGMISAETLKTYTFTVPTTANYTLSLISGSAVIISGSSMYILRKVSIF